MICSLARATGNRAALSFLVTWLAIAAIAVAQDRPDLGRPGPHWRDRRFQGRDALLDVSLERRPIPRRSA